MPSEPMTQGEGAGGEHRDLADLRQELETTRERIALYGRLIEDLPGIYEEKFRDRLDPLLERNRQLAEEERTLREELSRRLPGQPAPGRSRPTLPPAGRARGERPRFAAVPAVTLLLGLAAGGALLLAGRLLVQGLRPADPPAATLAPPAEPADQDGSASTLQGGPSVRADELLLSVDGLSWVEVRSLEGERIFVGNLRGERRLPLGKGVRISAGRPDLVTVEANGRPARILGEIDETDWQTFLPDQRTRPENSQMPAASRAQPAQDSVSSGEASLTNGSTSQ
jgi:hypothetical protein